MTTQGHNFYFYYSQDINLPVKIKVSSLDGNLKLLQALIVRGSTHSNYDGVNSFSERAPSTFFIQVQLFANGKPLSMPAHTSFSSYSSNAYRWDEVIEFPLLYKDLPVSTMVVFTIKGIVAPRQKIDVGGTSFSLFGNKKKTLKQGRQKLYVWPGKPGDGNIPSTTPGKCMENRTDMDKIESLIKKFETKEIPRVDWLDKFVGKAIEKVHEESSKSPNISLFVTTPDFPYPVIYYQKPCNIGKDNVSNSGIFTVYDPELSNNNPVEEKHIILSRGRRRDLTDFNPELKPNFQEKELLRQITNYPPTRHLNSDEQELVWRFRYYLQNNKKAMTKFLKCIDWSKPTEVVEAQKLMKDWAPIDVDDALEMLSSQFKENQTVRSYAVKRLNNAPNDELSLFLLQLVQALRYEKNEPNFLEEGLAVFLFKKAFESLQLGIQLYWYLIVESKNPKYQRILQEFLGRLDPKMAGSITNIANHRQHPLLKQINLQKNLVSKLSDISLELQNSSLSRPAKIEQVKKWLSKPSKYYDLSSFEEPTLLPLHPQIYVTGIKPDTYVFKSAMAPLLLTFNTAQTYNNRNEFKVIFKTGDDLRQDQLVVQLISLMDQLLKKENLDLCLTPYKVLATSPCDGMVQAVLDSKNVADVINEYSNQPIQSFLRAHHPDSKSVATYGIQPAILDRFLRSCAGYCIITYILGIGDRHLDNLLITRNGELFHIDFGFILGRDPKPFPPPVKASPEMVEGMGGIGSVHFNAFVSYSCTAYNILRKSSNLILNLISLMIDADIPHINQGEKSILKIQEKFKLDFTDEEANGVVQQLITESVRALAPLAMEAMHRWKKYWSN